MFEHTWRELELWLEHLDSTAEEHKETVIQFLERVRAQLHSTEWALGSSGFLGAPVWRKGSCPASLSNPADTDSV